MANDRKILDSDSQSNDSQKALRVLLVEDNPLDRQALELFIKREKLPYALMVANSIEQGYEYIKQNQYDIALLDYMLQDGTGFDILRRLVGEVPVVFITGTGTEEIAIKAMREGAGDYLIKDLDRTYLKLLPLVIERTLQNHEREQEQLLLSRALRDSNDSIFLTDTHGIITFVNDTFCRVYQYEKSDIIGQHFHVLYPPDKLPDVSIELADVVCQHVRQDRTQFTAAISRSAVENTRGVITGYGATSRDITETIALTEALRTSENMLKSILNSQSTFVARTTLQGLYTYVNNSLYERYRWLYPRPEDMLGTASMATVVPEDHAVALDAVEKCLMQPGIPQQVTFRKITEDGGDFVSLWDLIAIADDDGNIVEIQSVGIDITETQRVKDREFQLALERERMNVLSDFIRDTSHEFMTPLSIINLNAELAIRKQDPATIPTKMGKIQAQVKRIHNLVNTLLLMMSLQEDSTIEKESVNLVDAIRVAGGQVKAHYPDTNTLVYELDADHIDVLGHKDYLVNALEQVLDNAFRFGKLATDVVPDEYALDATITPDAPRYLPVTVRIKASIEDQQVCVEVIDDGAGINAKDIPNVFKEFWRYDSAHSTSGFGLGLSIARHIIEAHHGQISLTSTLGQGTTVRIQLPLTGA